MGQRRRARECAVQMLYQIDQAGDAADLVFSQFWVSQEATAELKEFAERLVRGTCEHRIELDRKISASTQRWRLDRMAVVDRNILRLAAYELIHETDTPAAVVIDEAVEIGKRFGSSDSGKFINGILDEIRGRQERNEAS